MSLLNGQSQALPVHPDRQVQFRSQLHIPLDEPIDTSTLINIHERQQSIFIITETVLCVHRYLCAWLCTRVCVHVYQHLHAMVYGQQ